jgi:hypothetical protein
LSVSSGNSQSDPATAHTPAASATAAVTQKAGRRCRAAVVVGVVCVSAGDGSSTGGAVPVAVIPVSR